MPVRTIKLKLVVPRGPERRETARALWATHAAINDAVRYYEDCLLSMRGGRYLERDGWIEQNSVRERLLVLIDAARNRNTIAVPVDDDVAIRRSDNSIPRLCLPASARPEPRRMRTVISAP
jgi:hypothetical protein